VSEQLLKILQLCLLALLYLFFFRVVRAVWAEVRAPAAAPSGAGAGGARSRSAAPARPAAPAAAPAGAAGAAPSGRRKKGRPTELVATAPASRQGSVYPIGAEVTVGRAGGCAISLPEDTFVSSLHARVYTNGNQVLVEDLGSTNGTFLNEAKLTSPTPVTRGDRLRVGSTVLEAR
jgi:pSer/pThr/pTyr-binding forkhead associated (FHA) protein